MDIKNTLITAGVIGTITVVSLLALPEETSDPCAKGEIQVWVDKETACIEDILENRKASMYAEITKEKINDKGVRYDVEIANWGVFWKTLSETAREKGLTAEELENLVRNDKAAIIELLNTKP